MALVSLPEVNSLEALDKKFEIKESLFVAAEFTAGFNICCGNINQGQAGCKHPDDKS